MIVVKKLDINPFSSFFASLPFLFFASLLKFEYIIMEMYKLCKAYGSRTCFIHKDNEFFGTADCYHNGFLYVEISEDIYFLHVHCLILKKSKCNHNTCGKADYCVILPQTKIIAYLTRENFQKKKSLLLLNNPFIRLLDFCKNQIF